MDKTKILFILTDALAIFAAIKYTIYLLLLPPLIYIMYLHRERRSYTFKKREVLLISRKILTMLETGGNISTYLKYVGEEEKNPGMISVINLLKRKMLGELNLHSKNLAKGHIGEIQEMLTIHIENGKNVSKRLSLFSRRLESEIRNEEKFYSKVNGLKGITYMGLIFFLPLFAGISSSILGTSMGFIAKNYTEIQNGFLLTVLAYIGIILYITETFSKHDKGILERLGSVLPLFSISAFMMTATAHYAVSIL
jgi:hypothetical protein